MKKHRWIIISIGLWGLVFLAGLGMRSLSMQTNEELAAIPLPQKPSLDESLENAERKESASKVELYRGEIQKKQKEQYITPPKEREERVQMAWSEVYKEENNEDINEESKEEFKQNKGRGEDEINTLREKRSSTLYQAPSISKANSETPNTLQDSSNENKSLPTQSGFNTQVFSSAQKTKNSASVKASIWTEQEVRSGEAVKLKTKEPMTIDGQKLPAGSMLIGTCQVGKRLFIEIKSLSMGGKLKEVKLSCLDAEDNQPGLIVQKPSLDENLQKELTGSAVDEALSELPGGGILQSGKRIIKQVISGRNKNKLVLPHGYEIIIQLAP